MGMSTPGGRRFGGSFMVDLSPFRQTRQLIGEIDDYLDKVSEAVMVF